MRLIDITQRREAVVAEMTAIYDAAEKASEDLAGEKLNRWNALAAERDDLAAKEQRAKVRDDLDRKADAKPVEKRDGDGSHWAIRSDQKVVDFIQKTTGIASEGLSVGRVVQAMHTSDWRNAEAERRVMGSSSNVAGGFLIGDPIAANIIDLIRNASVVSAAGAITVPVTGNNISMARLVTDPTAQWRGEGQPITESDASFEQIYISPGSLACLVRVNAELLDDVVNFAAMLDNMISAALAAKLDLSALYGSGVSAEPLGLRGAADIKEVSMGTNGAAQTTYNEILDLLQKLEESNATPTTLIHSPRTKTKLAKLTTGIASDLTKLTPPADYVALRKLTSNQVSIAETQGSSNVASTTFVGGFDNLAFAIRTNLQVETSRVSGDTFSKNQVLVRGMLRADVAALRPSQLGRLIGIL
jgi:HK97 family phage major capsid protein